MSAATPNTPFADAISRSEVTRRPFDSLHIANVGESFDWLFGHADRDAPVHDVDLAEATDHHVVWLDVAVKDPFGVCELYCAGGFPENLEVASQVSRASSLA